MPVYLSSGDPSESQGRWAKRDSLMTDKLEKAAERGRRDRKE